MRTVIGTWLVFAELETLRRLLKHCLEHRRGMSLRQERGIIADSVAAGATREVISPSGILLKVVFLREACSNFVPTKAFITVAD